VATAGTIEAASGFTIGDPADRLRPYVDRYIGYWERSDVEWVRREAAGAFAVLIIGWGAPLEVTDPRAADRGVTGVASFAAGTFDSYALTRTVGVGRGVELLLTPLVAGRILGLPMGELANRAVGLDQLPGRWLPNLQARLAETAGWPRRFALLDEAMTARLAATAPPDRRVQWAWDQLAGSHGMVGIAGLASELGWSRRHLAAVFRRDAGLTPKMMARVLRFQRAHSYLDRVDRHGGWSGVAAACGYYDQPHLIRDFREFAGATPGELAGGGQVEASGS
jgi:AraC-like DNA-binding protein